MNTLNMKISELWGKNELAVKKMLTAGSGGSYIVRIACVYVTNKVRCQIDISAQERLEQKHKTIGKYLQSGV